MKDLQGRAEEIVRALINERDRPALPIVLEGLRGLVGDFANYIEESSQYGRVLTDHAFSQGPNYPRGVCRCGLGRDGHRKKWVKRKHMIERLRKIAEGKE